MVRPDLGKYSLSQKFNDICCQATYARFGYIGHNGLDIAIPCGKPLYASHSGKVSLYTDPNGYGLAVFITGGGYESVTAHMSRRIVKTGQAVKEKQLIGYSGTSGFSDGCHCHFGARPIPYYSNNGFGGYIDPTPLLKEEKMITKSQLEIIFRLYLGIAPSTTNINTYVGKKTFEQTLAAIVGGTTYKAAIARANAGTLDAKNHLPGAIRQVYKTVEQPLSSGLYRVT